MFTNRKAARDRLKSASRAEYEHLTYEAKLTPKEAEILSMHILNDKRIKEIAQQMKCGCTIIRNYLARAYDKVFSVAFYEPEKWEDSSIDYCCLPVFLLEETMYVYYNPNPQMKRVGDCVIRALAKLMDRGWDRTYIDVCMQGYELKDMPSANHVWGTYLKRNDYIQRVIPDTCPECYRVTNFCDDHPEGKYLLATGSHVIAVVDGNYYDTWDSGDEYPVYYWEKRKGKE